MIGKLIKNELKAGIHYFAGIYVAAIGAVAAMAFSLIFKISWLTAISMVAIVGVAIAILVVTLFSIILNFNKTMFRDQGYLTFTLPATSGQLLFAKALCSFMWLILSYVAVIGLFMGIYSYVYSQVDDQTVAMAKTLLSTITELPDVGAIVSVVTFIIIRIFLTIIVLVAEIFFAVSLSNVRPFQRQSVIPAIIIFVVIYGVMQTVSYLLTAYVPLSAVISVEGVKFVNTAMAGGGMTFGVADIVFGFVMTGVFFCSSAWLMNHKINLK